MRTETPIQTPKIPIRAYRTLPNSGLAEVKVEPEKLALELKQLILDNFETLYNKVGSYCDFAIDDKAETFKITLNWTSKPHLKAWKEEITRLISDKYGFKCYHAITCEHTLWNVYFSDGNWNCYGAGIVLRKGEIEAQARRQEEMRAESEGVMSYA